MCKSGKGAEATIAELGLAQVSDEVAIAEACDRVLAAESAKLAEYRAGRDKLFGFFVGQVMKAMGGKGNPKVVNEVLRRKLAGDVRGFCPGSPPRSRPARRFLHRVVHGSSAARDRCPYVRRDCLQAQREFARRD